MTLLFLDTEWADIEGSELLSMALLSEDGSKHFYAERMVRPNEITPFVIESVLPLLEGGAAAMEDAAFTDALRRFIASIPNPVVLYDYVNDGYLLDVALKGFRCLPSELEECYPYPRGVEKRLIEDAAISAGIEDLFAKNPEAARRRHHALVDASMLRQAWARVCTDQYWPQTLPLDIKR